MFSKEPNFPWKQDSSHPLTPLNYLVVVTPHSSEINRTTKAKIRTRAPNLRLVGLSLSTLTTINTDFSSSTLLSYKPQYFERVTNIFSTSLDYDGCPKITFSLGI